MFAYPLVPIVNKWLIYWSQTAMMVSIIILLVRSRGHFASSHFVNQTGRSRRAAYSAAAAR
jgi:hypothetical protein